MFSKSKVKSAKKATKTIFPRLTLVPVPQIEKKPNSAEIETIAIKAKRLLDKLAPCIEWDIVSLNKIACVIPIGNTSGFFASKDSILETVKNIASLPGITMIKMDDFMEGGVTYIARGFIIIDPDKFFKELTSIKIMPSSEAQTLTS
jgi:4-aminobutyrate aminotransferase-like enzyme